MSHKFAIASVLIVLFVGAASAQSMSLLPTGQDKRQLSAEEQQRQDDIERNYREAVGKMPDRKAATDPWGKVRPAPATTSSAAKPKQ
jgi:hypothetical protein